MKYLLKKGGGLKKILVANRIRTRRGIGMENKLVSEKQESMYLEAQKYLVGGGSAGGRYNATFGQPLYLDHCDGSKLYDVDGKMYIDYHTSAGPALFGYNNPRLKRAAVEALEKGYFLNFDSEETLLLAQELIKIVPCAELVRFLNSGTEATMAALRIARAYTERDIVIRMEGHFHGMHELLWYNHNEEGSMDKIGEIENIPDGAGLAEIFGSVVKNVEFNDYEALERVVHRYKEQIAAVILEPIAYNCGCYPAKKDYLQKVRELCTKEKIVLIFDEVISGYRIRPGTAQGHYGVTPDLTTMAKAIGGGFAISALVGKKEVMEMGSPVGRAGVSGTYSGALLPVRVALECARMVQEPWFFEHMEKIGNTLYDGMNDLLEKHLIPGHVRGMGSRFGIYFGVEDPEDDFNWREVKKKYNASMNEQFLTEMLHEGIYFHNYGTSPVPPHNGFTCMHTLEDVEVTLEKIDRVFRKSKIKK